jgi:hypothetical protein
MRVVISAGVILLTFVLAMVLMLEFWPREVAYRGDFRQVPIDFNFYDWFDAGATDLNADRYLDVYTSNHDARQNLLLGMGDGRFSDALSLLGFDQDREFPGLEDTNVATLPEKPGFYVYYLDGKLVLQSVAEGEVLSPVSGTIALSSPVGISKREGFQVAVDATSDPSGIDASIVSFTSEAEGQLAMVIPFKASPITVELEASVSLQDVFIGHQRVSPEAHRFELYVRDRHGIAWADLNGDGYQDAFISRGGLNGKIRNFPIDIGNELLLTMKSHNFENFAKSRGIAKRGCPGRQVAWVDYDSDGDLDLYLVCGRQTGGFWEYIPAMFRRGSTNGVEPNRLYQQSSDGTFVDVASETGLAFGEGGTAAWLDADGDSDMDLIWASGRGITLYRNGRAGFEPEAILPQTTTQVRKLAIGDFDADGDPDVYAVSAIGSRLLVNKSGKLYSLSPDEFGLPSLAKTANWIDYDNDGLLDLHTWPQGIYLQLQDGKFEETGILSVPTPWSVLMDARVLWFDFDNDGDRDVLVLQRYFPHIMQEAFPKLFPFNGVLLENVALSSAHWVQIRLIGDTGNRESIGSRISVSSAGSVQHQWVGQSEGSHYSQGHYRTYFGLGASADPVQVRVHWPDGEQDLMEVAVDQLVVISRNSAP